MFEYVDGIVAEADADAFSVPEAGPAFLRLPSVMWCTFPPLLLLSYAVVGFLREPPPKSVAAGRMSAPPF